MKIYLVDDDTRLRDALRDVLLRAGHEVLVDSNGLTAVQQLRGWPADLIVCDMLMPDVEGFEVLRTLRRNAIRTKFIMMSGASGELSEFLERAPLLGVDAVLQKPFTPQELLDLIDAVFAGETRGARSATGNG